MSTHNSHIYPAFSLSASYLHRYDLMCAYFSIGTEQCKLQERRASSDGELRVRAPINGVLLQPEERLAARPDPGARNAKSAGAIPADDLRRIPFVHPATGTEREVTSGVFEDRMM